MELNVLYFEYFDICLCKLFHYNLITLYITYFIVRYTWVICFNFEDISIKAKKGVADYYGINYYYK